MQEYKWPKSKLDFWLPKLEELENTRMEEDLKNLFDRLFDFATKVADDDWGLSRQELVTEARTLLDRTYPDDSDDEDSRSCSRLQ